MPCKITPAIPDIALPTGISFAVTTPAIAIDTSLCCKKLPFKKRIPPIPLGKGVQVPPPILIAISAGKKLLLDWIANRSIKCPRE